MSSKKIEREIVTFLRKKGGQHTPCRGDYIGDIMRASGLKRVTRRDLEAHISHCVDSGIMREVSRGRTVVGLKLCA